ncbi:uncharacterized protein [Euphorbia lathyris]|uniref:uncharacterized protein isoform X1 n=1 Tax=Euphorbia lathyris TaxID=212925 RepID=UPI003313E7E6
MENKRPRILCLHGFRNSAEILKKLVDRWPLIVRQKLDLVFLDAPFSAQPKSNHDPPSYEWFQGNEDYSEYWNFEECLNYLENYMIEHGPFDGFLGFSQGAVLAAAVPGMQKDGVCLNKVPKLKFLILISGAKFGGKMLTGLPKLAANAFSSPLHCPSLHFIGETDIVKEEGIDLAEAFVNPVLIHHLEGHTVPILDGENLEKMVGFIERIKQ